MKKDRFIIAFFSVLAAVLFVPVVNAEKLSIRITDVQSGLGLQDAVVEVMFPVVKNKQAESEI